VMEIRGIVKIGYHVVIDWPLISVRGWGTAKIEGLPVCEIRISWTVSNTQTAVTYVRPGEYSKHLTATGRVAHQALDVQGVVRISMSEIVPCLHAGHYHEEFRFQVGDNK
jgi:hypothetical protein